MSGGTQMEAGQLLKCGEGEFEKTIQDMSLKNLLDTISMLQKEMSREQASFNSQTAQLATLNKNSRQYKQISKEMNTSQTRLTMLMNRSMKCFQQQGNQHIKAAASSPAGVQRHNSNVEPKESGQGTSVQRRHSSKVSATDGEVIKSGFDTKVTTQNSGPKKPVILQPIVNTSRMPGMGNTNSKVTTTNGVSGSSTESTSVSSISLKSDSKSSDPRLAQSNVVTSTASASVSSLSNGTSSTVGSSSTKSITSTNTAPVSSLSDSKRTSILNFGVKNTVQNLERKSVVNVSTSQVVTNGTGARSTTSNTSKVVVKPASVKDNVSASSAVSKPVVSSVVTKPATTAVVAKPATTAVVSKQATTAVVSKPVSSGVVTKTVTSSIQVSSEATKKIPDAPVAPVIKKVSQPSKYSRPPINQPVDPREQMLSEIRSFKRPADAPKVEPIRKAEATEVKLNITQGKPAQPQKEVSTAISQQKVVPVSVSQKKTAPFSIPQQNVVPATAKQQIVAPVSVKTSEKPKEQEKKEKETVRLDAKSTVDQTVRAEPVKLTNSMVTEDKPKVTQPTAKVTDDNVQVSESQAPSKSQTTTEDEAESEEDRPEEKFVSSVTFAHQPSKPTEIVKPKTKVQAPSPAMSSVVAPSPASVPVPAEPKQGKPQAMSDNPDVLSPTDDNSHLSEGTRLRMQRVRDLEQQRLQRVLARSIATAQQSPAVAQQDVAAEPRSPTLRSPNLGSRSPNSTRSTGRARYVTVGRTSRSISEDRNNAVVARLPLKDENSENVSQAEEDETSNKDETSVRATGEANVFMKKLDELASSAESDEIKQRYLRLKELEEARLHGRQESERSIRGSATLGRSASVNEHVSAGRLARRNSDQVRQRHGSPVMPRRLAESRDDSSDVQLSRASSASNLYTPDLSSLDKFFNEKRQESLRRIEELAKRRQQGPRSMSLDTEPGERSTRERFLESITHPAMPRIEPLSSMFYTRTHETPIQYSSIDERLETISPRYGSDTSLNRIGTGSFEDLRRGSGEYSTHTTHLFRDPTVPGLTYVNEEGHAQWITPSSPLYKQMKTTEKPPSVDLKLEERKKRSLLAREGLEDHFLTECFDPDISFEERIGLIREKLYGSKVLIPSDKRRAMADRGSPDGASNVLKGSSASGGTDNEGHR